jgi:NTE family protein
MRAKMTTAALVMGGGGPVGIAWEAGVMAGLAREGFAPAWDLIVGTSAGSFVGAHLAAGKTPEELAREQISAGLQENAGKAPPAMNFDPSAFAALYARMPLDRAPDAAFLQEFGVLSRTGAVVPEELYLMAFAEFAEMDWPACFTCTAVDVDTGQFTLLRADHGGALFRGVAASCAVPGIFPPVEIGGRLWMDGGCRSATSADAAVEYDRVLTLAVQTPLSGPAVLNAMAREAAAIEAAGGRHARIAPDADALAVFPKNLMDGRNRAAIAEAGLAQGQREAARIKAAFS